jgi:anaerobic ribonucleoside-triphosphate reductase
MSKEEIRAELDKAKKEMGEVKGTECEVFSRVCGYLRPVQNYNRGKKEEFFLRKKFNVECGCN